jgi:hypothetical protein
MEEYKLSRMGTLFVPTRFDSDPAWAKCCLPTLRDYWTCAPFVDDIAAFRARARRGR